MAQQTLLGGDGVTGETGATHNSKANANFTELYANVSTAQNTADSANTNLSVHISDTSGAHAASAISAAPFGSISATTVQGQLEELAAEAGGTVPDADATTKGIARLYDSTSLGAATDGAPSQVAVKTYVDNQIAAIDGPDLFETYKTKTATHALDGTDLADVNLGKLLVFLMNSASGLTLTLTANATQAFPVGSMIQFAQSGIGQVTIAPDAGVTMRAANSANKTYAQYSQGYARKIATNEWMIGGDITV